MPMISDKDLELVDAYRKAFAHGESYDICGNYAPIEEVLREWEAAKSEYLFDMFGGEFILEKEIKYAMPISDIRYQMTQAMVHEPFLEMMRHWLRQNLDDGNSWGTHWYMFQLLSTDHLASNRVPSNWEVYNLLVKDTKITVAPNAKIIKILSKLVKIADDNELTKTFEEFRLKHSRVLNTTEMHGTLCISIHPLDYLTMSDNASCWTSCMSWMDDGSCRRGTIEMMNSPSVVVAYLKSETPFKWDGYEWNNKKWRSLFVITPEIMTSVKGYPYTHEPLARIVLEWLRELAKPYLGEYHDLEAWKPGVYDSHTFCGKNFEWIDVYPGGDMYNDIGRDVTHWGALNVTVESTERKYIEYGGKTQCIVCGSTSEWFPGEENTVACNNCARYEDDKYYCDCCGYAMDEDEAYWIDDVPYCNECVYEVATECVISRDYVYNNEICTVYLATEDDNPADGEIYCKMHERYTRNPLPDVCGLSGGKWTRATRPPVKYHQETHRYYWNLSELNDLVLSVDFDLDPCTIDDLRNPQI